MDEIIPVKVAVRIRPMVELEILNGANESIHVIPNTNQVYAGKDKSYSFDYSFDVNSTQEDVYNKCVKNLVDGFFQGYNATVFAYGQTGSGKTYTMGTNDDYNSLGNLSAGIIPRLVRDIFEKLNLEKKEHPEKTINIETSFLEIHKEIIHDLFSSDPMNTNLPIRESSNGDITVPGLTTLGISSESDFLMRMHKGAIHRTTASTNMNERSSRSHAICTISIHIQDDSDDGQNISAKFHLVDLAGSESAKKTGAEGNTLREGISINCGLLALGNVISALCDEKRGSNLHIPYRVSKLTRLLQDSLGGNSRTVMIACVSPADINYCETLNTLRYADRARQIKNKPVVNKDFDAVEINRLRQRVKELQFELATIKTGGTIVNNNKTETDSLIIATLEQKNKVMEAELTILRKNVIKLQSDNNALKRENKSICKEKDTALLLLEKHGIKYNEEDVEDELSILEQRLKEIELLKTDLQNVESKSDNISEIDIDEMMNENDENDENDENQLESDRESNV